MGASFQKVVVARIHTNPATETTPEVTHATTTITEKQPLACTSIL
jgi:hypothetical protein